MGEPIAPRELPLLLEKRESLQASICSALRAAIQQGRLRPGARLPSSRDLARQLHVARGTVVLAYDQLTAEGYIRGARGAGTTVVTTLPERWLAPGPTRTAPHRIERGVTLSVRGLVLAHTPFPRTPLPAPRPFRPHTPAVDLFPGALWGNLIAKHARSSRPARLREADPKGYRPLREAIAEHLRVYRGVVCSPEQILITSGTQQSLDLLTRLLLDEGDVAWMEDPGHFGARDVLRAAGVRVAPVPVDAAGMDVEAGIRNAPEARLVYVTPARQSPTGATLSLERRLKLLDWARRKPAWIFEDDYDAEFRYAGRPLPALQSLDRHGVVLYSGTFAKTMFPGLRVAYAVLPEGLVEPFASALSLIARYTPLLPQLALADFIADGHFARHLRRMRLIYAERREALLSALQSELSEQIEIVGSSAGLELVACLPGQVNDRAVAKLAFALGVELLPLSRYAIRPSGRSGLVLGFAAVSSARSRKAVPLLRAAIRQAQRG